MKVQFKRNGCCEYDKNVMAFAKKWFKRIAEIKKPIHFLEIYC